MPIDIALVNTIAPLKNVTLLGELLDRVIDRARGLPGMATFHGPSGFGKSFAALYNVNKYRAHYVQVRSVWTRKKLCQAILAEMGIQAAPTIADMMDQIGQELSLSRRPLIIDEADFLVQKGMVEVLRDIFETSHSAIILIGEENLPASLKRWERVHGRMLDWVAAQPATLADAEHLAKLYCRGIKIAEELLKRLHEASGASIRRICVNLDRMREEAVGKGLKTLSSDDFSGQFFTGHPPARRLSESAAA